MANQQKLCFFHHVQSRMKFHFRIYMQIFCPVRMFDNQKGSEMNTSQDPNRKVCEEEYEGDNPPSSQAVL